MYKTQKIKATLNGLQSDDSLPPSRPPPETVYSCFSCFERSQPWRAGSTCSLPGNVGKERKGEKGLMNTTLLSSCGQEAAPLIQAAFQPGGQAVGHLPAAEGRDPPRTLPRRDPPRRGQRGRGPGAVLDRTQAGRLTASRLHLSEAKVP